MKVDKKAGMDQTQIFKVDVARIKMILEYTFQVWSPDLTVMMEHDIEHVQNRVLQAIWTYMSYIDCIEN